MKIQDLVTQATQFLKESSPSARLDAEIIISDTLKCRREDLIIQSQKFLAPTDLQKCLQKIERRIQGEPVSYITNKKDFLNHTFFVQPGVLVPRPETELLVEYVLHWIEENNSEKELWGLDLGTGSGCIAVSLLKEVFKMKMAAIDISSTAIQTAQINAEQLGVTDKLFLIQKNADELQFQDFDFLKDSGFSGQFDFVISNPPYISSNDKNVEDGVKKFEPKEALFCDNEGLEKIQKWTNQAGVLLRPGGLWIFEIGSLQGTSATREVQKTEFFEKIQVAQDYSGRDRFVISHRKNQSKQILTN